MPAPPHPPLSRPACFSIYARRGPNADLSSLLRLLGLWAKWSAEGLSPFPKIWEYPRAMTWNLGTRLSTVHSVPRHRQEGAFIATKTSIPGQTLGGLRNTSAPRGSTRLITGQCAKRRFPLTLRSVWRSIRVLMSFWTSTGRRRSWR